MYMHEQQLEFLKKKETKRRNEKSTKEKQIKVTRLK